MPPSSNTENLSIEQMYLINQILKYDLYDFNNINNLDRNEIRKEINWFEEKIVSSTRTFFFIIIFFLSFLPFIYGHEYEHKAGELNYTYIYLGTFFLFSLLWLVLRYLLIPRFPYHFGKGKKFEEKLIDRVNQLEEYPFLFRIFVITAAIQPFKFKNIWWWSLIFSFIVANFEYIEKGGRFSFRLVDFDKRAFLDYSVSLTKGLLISVLAYIASNIIRELLTLRDKYSDTHTQVETLSKTISQSEQQLESIMEGLSFADAFSSIRNKIVKSSLGNLNETFEGYKRALIKQIDVFHDRLSDRNTIINFWLISALSGYAKLTATNFEEGRTVITNFKLFAFFIKETIENLLKNEFNGPEQECEVYSIVIFSPERYFNYKETNIKVEGNDNLGEIEKIRYSDKGWDEYLDVNRKASLQKKLKQHRHFISIKASDDIFKTLKEKYDAEELNSLRDTKVIKELNYKFILETTEQKLVKSKFANNEEAYTCDKYADDFQWHLNQYIDNKNFEPKQIRNVLNEVYHQSGCCQVIEITVDDSNMDNLSEFLFDKDTKKPIDYYAIRSKTIGDKKGEWLLSFKGPYDKSFDIIKLQILSRDDPIKGEEWEEEKKRLDKIFFSNSLKEIKRIGVDKYGNEEQ